MLELLAAMTLLGLLMTALFGGLRLGTRVWEASDRVLNDESRALAVRSFLHDRLEQTLPARHQHADGGSRFVFSGERTALRFASTMPHSLGSGPFVMELVLRPGPDQAASPDLALRWRAFDADGEQAAGHVDERVLITGLSTIAFAYFGAKDEVGSTPAWHATWQDQAALPDLIRLDVGLDDDSSMDWPSLIVPTKVNAWQETAF